MSIFPDLTWIERWAVWILHRSPRVSLLAIKHHDYDVIGWSYSYADPVAVEAVERLQTLVMDNEPVSMALERMFHAPAYGEE